MTIETKNATHDLKFYIFRENILKGTVKIEEVSWSSCACQVMIINYFNTQLVVLTAVKKLQSCTWE